MRKKKEQDEFRNKTYNGGGIGYSQDALDALMAGQYDQLTGRDPQYRTSQDQLKQAKSLPVLKGIETPSSSVNNDWRSNFSTDRARRNYERRINHVTSDVEAQNLRNRGYEGSFKSFDFDNLNAMDRDYLNAAYKQREEAKRKNATRDTDLLGMLRKEIKTGTPEERQNFLNKYGATYDEVLDAYGMYRDAQERKKREDHPYLTALGDLPSAFERGIQSAAGWAAHTAFPNSDLDLWLNNENSLAKVNEVEKKRDYSRNSSKMSDAEKKVLQAYYNIGDLTSSSLTGGLIGGGGAIVNPDTGTILSFEPSKYVAPVAKGVSGYGLGAESKYRELKKRGVSEDKAREAANIAGVTEALQSVSTLGTGAKEGASILSSILNGAKSQGLISLGRQAIEELSEKFILGNEGAYDQSVAAYKQSGMSDSDAKVRAVVDIAERMGLAGLGGIVFGGITGAASGALSKIGNKVAENLDDTLNSVWATQNALPQNNIPRLTGSAETPPNLPGGNLPALPDNIYPIQMPGTNGVINLPGATSPIQLPDLAAKSLSKTAAIRANDGVIRSEPILPSMIGKSSNTPTSTGASAPTLQSEQDRINAFMTKKVGKNDSIEMENGQVLEKYSMKEMKSIIKDAKDNGLPEGFQLDIRYKDGSEAYYSSGDDTSNIKMSNIDSVVWRNDSTDAYAGNNVSIYPDDTAVDNAYWRMTLGEAPQIAPKSAPIPANAQEFSESPKPNFVPGEFKQALDDGTMSFDDIISKTTTPFQGAMARLDNDEYVDPDELYDLPEIAYMLEHMKEGTSLEDYGDRPELWNELADEYLSRTGSAIIDSTGKAQYNGDIEQGHKLIFVTGYPGSGKSSKVVNPLSERFKALVADVDEVKKLHPENKDGLNDEYVHGECQKILSVILDRAISEGDNIVIPIIGGDNTDSFISKIKAILGNKLNDYEVGIVCNDYLSKNKASSRILGRIVGEGRFSPPDLPYRVKVDPLVNYTRLLERGRKNGINISGFASLDNNVSKDQPAIVRNQGGFLDGFFGKKEMVEGESGENGKELPALYGDRTGRTSLTNSNPEEQPTSEAAFSDAQGYWLRVLGDDEYAIQESEKYGMTPEDYRGIAAKSLGIDVPPTNGGNEPPQEPNMKTSQTYTNTGKNGGGWTEEEYAQYTDPSQFQYESIDEQESVNRAIDMRTKEGREGFKNRMMKAQKASGAEIDGLMMEWRQLGEEARALEAAGGDSTALRKEAIRVFRKVQELSTESAQGLQALAKWSRNTPEGMLSRAEHIANGRIKKDGSTEKSAVQKTLDKVQKNKKDFKFSDEFINEFLARAEEVMQLPPESRELKVELAKLGKMVNEQIPVKISEKVTAFLMDNMLGNFRTLISRNAGGNVGLNAVEQFIQRPLAAGIDSIVSRKTGVRTQSGLTRQGLADYMKGFKQGISEEVDDFKKGLHTARSGEVTLENAINSNRHVFKTKFFDGMDNLVKTGLSLGDRPFYEAVYSQTLGDYYRLRDMGKMGDILNNLSDSDFDEFAKAAAKMNALAAVYQKDSMLSNALMGIKNSVGDLSRGVLGVDVLSQFSMPFVKTPAGVVDVAIDYSPIGLVRNSIRTGKEIHNKEFDQNRFVNESSRNILGTLGMTAGAGAALGGILGKGYSEDKDEKNAQKAAGEQEYALNIGDNGELDISWVPVLGSNAVASAATVDAYKKAKEKGDTGFVPALMKGLEAGGESLLQQAVFQGMQKLFGGDSYNSDKGIVGNMVDTVKSGVGQGIPSLVRQTAQTLDPYTRDLVNSNPNLSFGSWDNYDINSYISNIPILRNMMLAPKVGTNGELVKANDGRNIVSRAFENMVLPGKVTKVQYNALDQEASRLKEATTSSDAFMPLAQRKNVDTADHTLSNKEWTEFQQNYYGTMTEVGTKLMDTTVYKESAPADQVKILKSAYDGIKYALQSKYNGKEVDGAAKRYLDAGGGEKGVQAVVNYCTDNAIKNDIEGKTGLAGNSKANESIQKEVKAGNKQKADEMVDDATRLSQLGLTKPGPIEGYYAAQRKCEDPSNNYTITVDEFANTYKQIDGADGTAPNQGVTLDEVCAFANKKKYDETQMQRTWDLFAPSSKQVPFLKEDGSWGHKSPKK